MELKQKVLLTTAISYTNGSPHIGHLYEAILGDFIKRVYEIMSFDVKLLTGTDEHGKKIQTTAQACGINPIELCDKYSEEFKQMNNLIGSSYDYFIRTTELAHKELVSKSIELILKKNISNYKSNSNTIYLGEYSGYYNMREECYITELQASQTNYLDPLTFKPYEIVKESTYYFVLNKFTNIINKTIDKIEPANLRDEIRLRVTKGLDDLSISRTSFTWGIPLPITLNTFDKTDTTIISNNNDNSHIIYVWFDALLNYITGKNILFPNEPIESNIKSIHIIGKDILWFHSVIYPAILEACGYTDSFPYKIVTHGFVTDKDGRKMSKSLGNVISNEKLLKTYPIEAIRYYFITNTIMGEDFKFDSINLVNMYNNILIKGFGNLFQRLLKVLKPVQIEINLWLDANNITFTLAKTKCNEMLEKFIDLGENFNKYNDYLNSMIVKIIVSPV